MNTGNNLLYLLVSALLAFLLVTGVAGWANLRRLEIALDPPEEIYDGAETPVKLRLHNAKRRLPAFLLAVEVQGGGPFLFRYLGAGEEGGVTATAIFRGRGRRPLPSVRVTSLYPVNFFARSLSLPLCGEATVFPAPHFCCTRGESGFSREPGEAAALFRGEGGELHRILDYTGNEPLRRIHWKLSARDGKLKVKEMSAPAGDPVILELDRLPGGGLEERLGSGVFLVNRLARENRPVGLRLGTRLIPPDVTRAHRLRLLRELAFHGQD